ncbi:MAG: hypothetical protein FWF91_01000 [Coriobacteriia bacterium]|nr:hypothetical protein [Coriobacteriia bacterium]
MLKYLINPGTKDYNLAVSRQKQAKWVGIFFFAVVVGLLVGLLVLFSGCVKSGSKFKTNSDGLTYGESPGFSKSSSGEIPDLIATEATNGERGYVYWTELKELILPSDPEENDRRNSEHAARNSLQFVSFIAESLGVEIEIDDVSALQAYDVAKTLYRLPYLKGPQPSEEEARDLLALYLSLDTSTLPEGEELIVLLDDIFNRISEENMVEIPVYLEDGKTQIGVYRAGG